MYKQKNNDVVMKKYFNRKLYCKKIVVSLHVELNDVKVLGLAAVRKLAKRDTNLVSNALKIALKVKKLS